MQAWNTEDEQNCTNVRTYSNININQNVSVQYNTYNQMK